MSKQSRRAVVTSIAGRDIQLYDQESFQAKLPSRSMQLIVGDQVEVNADGVVESIVPRRNTLMRTFGNLDKELAANLDQLFIVAAVDKLFNPVAIDRALVLAECAGIPASIILNKIDLGAEQRIDVYKKLGLQVQETSAKFGQGLQPLFAALQSPQLKLVALCGISGVGKSTLINRLVPGLDAKTREVSLKTGQGKQTTSQALAYRFPREGLQDLLIIDLPGSQHFGVSHLDLVSVAQAFPEFLAALAECEYSDCSHRAEPNCAVKRGIESGTIAKSRYDSYLNMCQELMQIPDSRKYRRR